MYPFDLGRSGMGRALRSAAQARALLSDGESSADGAASTNGDVDATDANNDDERSAAARLDARRRGRAGWKLSMRAQRGFACSGRRSAPGSARSHSAPAAPAVDWRLTAAQAPAFGRSASARGLDWRAAARARESARSAPDWRAADWSSRVAAATNSVGSTYRYRRPKPAEPRDSPKQSPQKAL